MFKATIIGNTSWGNTLASLLVSNKLTVNLWARNPDEAREVNERDLGYYATSDIKEALYGATLVLWVVPSQSLRRNVSLTSRYLEPSMLLISAAKGLEIDSGKRMSQVIVDEITPAFGKHVCALSGPNLAKDFPRALRPPEMSETEAIAIQE